MNRVATRETNGCFTIIVALDLQMRRTEPVRLPELRRLGPIHELR
jgi:hypothetical protein